MMSDSVDRILKADPNKVAAVLALGNEPGRTWLPDELEAVFRHQMTAPISVDLAAIGPEIAGQLRTLTDAQGLLLKSFHDLFQHPQPPLELLELVKVFAKLNRDRAESLLPNEVASVLYYLCIAAALIRLQKRITTLKDEELRHGLEWSLNQNWVDAHSRGLLKEAKERLSPMQSEASSKRT